MAVNRFTGATNGNTNTNTNWSLGVVPTAVDGNVATFDASSPAATVNAVLNCNALDMGAYTHNITMTNGIVSAGDLTIGPGMTFSGAGSITVSASANLRSNGAIMTQALIFSALATLTLLDEWITTGTWTPFNSAAARTFNGFAFRVRGNLATSNTSASGQALGTTQIIFDNPSGAGNSVVTAVGGSSDGAGGLRLPVTINTAGTVTFSGTNKIQGSTFSYIAGTVVTTGSTLKIDIATTLDLAGIIWNNVSIGNSSSATYTFLSPLTYTGTLNAGATSTTCTLNGSMIHAQGPIVQNSTSGTISGTTVVSIENDCTISQPSLTTGSWRGPMTINAPGKTVTLGTVFRHGSVTGNTVSIVASVIFAGSFGLDVNNLVVAAGVTVTFPSGITQRARLSWITQGTNASRTVLQSGTSTVSAAVTLDAGAAQRVRFTNATDIDSSGGQRIRDTRGVLTRTTNWVNSSAFLGASD